MFRKASHGNGWRPSWPPGRSQRGQSTVEMAMLLPALLVIALGVVDFGRLFNSWVVLNNAVREGAFYAAKNCTPPSTGTTLTGCPVDPRQVALSESSPTLSGAQISNFVVAYVPGTHQDQASGTYTFNFVSPFLMNRVSLTLFAQAGVDSEN